MNSHAQDLRVVSRPVSSRPSAHRKITRPGPDHSRRSIRSERVQTSSNPSSRQVAMLPSWAQAHRVPEASTDTVRIPMDLMAGVLPGWKLTKREPSNLTKPPNNVPSQI